MTSSAHSTSAYIKVFYVLLVLTIVEVAIVYLGLPKLLLAALLVIAAVWKASLVAMHFMHLKFEKRNLALVALISHTQPAPGCQYSTSQCSYSGPHQVGRWASVRAGMPRARRRAAPSWARLVHEPPHFSALRASRP